MSPARLDLFRRLVEARRFRLVAVVESFLPPAEGARLQAVLGAWTPLRLGPLRLEHAERFFREAARAVGGRWSPQRIHGLALASRGFPLGMSQLLATELDRRGSSGTA